jgi:hypothetical protein
VALAVLDVALVHIALLVDDLAYHTIVPCHCRIHGNTLVYVPCPDILPLDVKPPS